MISACDASRAPSRAALSMSCITSTTRPTCHRPNSRISNKGARKANSTAATPERRWIRGGNGNLDMARIPFIPESHFRTLPNARQVGSAPNHEEGERGLAVLPAAQVEGRSRDLTEPRLRLLEKLCRESHFSHPNYRSGIGKCKSVGRRIPLPLVARRFFVD